MRHRHGIRKIGRNSTHRVATLRNLAAALFTHERIVTTHGKARALRPFAERLITLSKRGDLHARRLAARDIRESETLRKLFDDIGPRFSERPGGYTRILKLGHRAGDQAKTALIELVDARAKAAAAAPAPDPDPDQDEATE
jgi:large subunit ribosomal protein L17